MVTIELHGSGTAQPSVGARYEATMTAGLEYLTDTIFRFTAANGGTVNGSPVTIIRPWDNQGTYPGGQRRESYWMGWTDGPDVGEMRLYTEYRLDRMIAWIKANLPNLHATKWVLTGGSMGGWGTLTYGIRRPTVFPALWPDRPRWRSSVVAGNVTVPSYIQAITPTYASASSPLIVAANGGGRIGTHMDITSYVANTANDIPWVGWHVGTADGYMPFQDHVDAVAALRAAGRGFAFYWNGNNHTLNNFRAAEITGSYPWGSFELGKGYPVFSEHSLDNDPTVDPIGGINVGLAFRNVVETTGTWSCQISYPGTLTRAAQACTVKVKPKSSIYTGNPAPQLVNVPAGAAWVTVTF